MANIRRGSFRGRSSQRRRTGWEDGPGRDTVQTAITASANAIATSALVSLEDGLTVARLRGRLEMWLSAADAVNSGFSGAFGIGIATSDAISVGATAVPTPITEQDWDGWLFWQSFGLFAPIGALTASTSLDGTQLRMDVDSKAMRKFDENMALYAVVEVGEVASATLQWRFDSRLLLFLP